MEDTQSTTATPTSVTAASPQVELQRDENAFSFGYANHVQVESNAFDLKMTFGLYDHRNAAKVVIDQFSSMNISWVQVKLLIYFMQLHLAGHEQENGKVKIPSSALPPEVPAIPPQFDNPKGREGFELIRKMRAEFIASQK